MKSEKNDMATSKSARIGGNASLKEVFSKGGWPIWVSCLIMGFADLVSGQVIKGLLYLLIEIALIGFFFTSNGGFYWISMLPSLGEREMEEVWNDSKGIYEYVMGDQSQIILLYGIASICLLVLLALLWTSSLKSGYRAICLKKEKIKYGFRDDLVSLKNENIHRLLMFLPVTFLFIFTVLPLIYMMSMAFTNYSKDNNKLVLFDWVGLKNFISIFDSKSVVGKQFLSVLGWTLIWAFFATFLNFFFGTILTLIINKKGVKAKGFFRGCLCITIAVPQFVSLLVIRSMFLPEGIINRMLMNANLIESRLPFLTNVTWARFFVIIINLWVGIPYTIMQVTGILQNIPEEQYEAARIDGANVVQQFNHVTLPHLLFVMTPYLITSFCGNINNFNVIYLLTRGEPVSVGNTAGGTDLLVTWLYKLSVDQQKYCFAAVIGIFTFVVLAIVSLLTYHSTNSYKNEEAFK